MDPQPESAPGPSAGPVVALTADLMFGARVKGTAEAVGASVRVARSGPELLRLAQTLSARLVIVDLDTRSLDPVALIRELKSSPELTAMPVLAYVSHVRADLIADARNAGADQVMARSAFVRLLPDILKGESHA